MVSKEELLEELKRISKNCWAGLPYSSFHHPKFTFPYLSSNGKPQCQRNTLERFEKLGIDVKGKLVWDLGCCTGAMLMQALLNGAHYVVGIDNHQPNIEFCKKLFQSLSSSFKYGSNFLCVDIDNLLEVHGDVIFCFAISKWVKDYDHLIKLLSESNAELIFFEDNKYMGKVIKDIIPGYDCKFVWKSGPEGNSPLGHPGWGRMNYRCTRVRE